MRKRRRGRRFTTDVIASYSLTLTGDKYDDARKVYNEVHQRRIALFQSVLERLVRTHSGEPVTWIREGDAVGWVPVVTTEEHWTMHAIETTIRSSRYIDSDVAELGEMAYTRCRVRLAPILDRKNDVAHNRFRVTVTPIEGYRDCTEGREQFAERLRKGKRAGELAPIDALDVAQAIERAWAYSAKARSERELKEAVDEAAAAVSLAMWDKLEKHGYDVALSEQTRELPQPLYTLRISRLSEAQLQAAVTALCVAAALDKPKADEDEGVTAESDTPESETERKSA